MQLFHDKFPSQQGRGDILAQLPLKHHAACVMIFWGNSSECTAILKQALFVNHIGLSVIGLPFWTRCFWSAILDQVLFISHLGPGVVVTLLFWTRCCWSTILNWAWYWSAILDHVLLIYHLGPCAVGFFKVGVTYTIKHLSCLCHCRT